jgi:hypothetical protein
MDFDLVHLFMLVDVALQALDLIQVGLTLGNEHSILLFETFHVDGVLHLQLHILSLEFINLTLVLLLHLVLLVLDACHLLRQSEVEIGVLLCNLLNVHIMPLLLFKVFLVLRGLRRVTD